MAVSEEKDAIVIYVDVTKCSTGSAVLVAQRKALHKRRGSKWNRINHLSLGSVIHVRMLRERLNALLALASDASSVNGKGPLFRFGSRKSIYSIFHKKV